MRARSRSELERDLKKREVPEQAVAAVLDRFTEVGLIDDASFAQEWVGSRGRRSGALRLRQELRHKGVAEEHIAEAINIRSDDEDRENALELGKRKAASMNSLDAVTKRRRLTAFLSRRGFSSAVINHVCGEVLQEMASDSD